MSHSAERVEEVFGAALEQADPPARAAYLAQACAGDDTLRREVEELLRAHEEAGHAFLEGPAPGVRPTASPALMADPTAEPDGAVRVPVEVPGRRVGRYVLVERIGEGGFGEVWLAEQEAPVRRRVALKVVKPGMDTREVIARFEAERQALALMDHPNIAKVFDAGTIGGAESEISNLPSEMSRGRPYFVMELVRGPPVTHYCDQHQVSTAERLQLFAQVCQAVQHAHQKGVVHRDLKPSNVLVIEQDGRPVPKVIDFGVAKALEGRLTDRTLITQVHQLIGTPCYMSPEQAGLGNLDIDTRSDIYSLGVLLYELLTGHTPFDAAEMARIGLDEMRRAVREREPVRPSTRLRAMPPVTQTAIARQRQTEPPKLVNLLRGDLDWIVMKCLEKDRNRRYATASGLAADIQRHLNDEPVVARPPSRLYRCSKMMRRNWLTFILVNAVAAALALGLGISSQLYVRERKAHNLAMAAEREQNRLREQAEDNLWQAYLAQAGAMLFSSQLGCRSDGLAALGKAAAIRSNLRVRNEAVALLAQPDIRLQSRLPHPAQARSASAVDLQFRRYAVADREGNIIVGQMEDATTNSALPGFGWPAVKLSFSPDGSYLAVNYAGPVPGHDGGLRVWEIGRRATVATWTNQVADQALDWHPREPALAFATSDGTIRLRDVSSGTEAQFNVETVPSALRFSPSGEQLAVASVARAEVWILDARRGRAISNLRRSQGIPVVAWHPTEPWIVLGSADHAIRFWDLQQGNERLLLKGHHAPISALAFNEDGSRLLSAGLDSMLCVWDPIREELLASVAGKCAHLQFDPRSQRLGLFDSGDSLGVYELVADRVSFNLVRGTNTSIHGAAFDPAGRILAVAADGQTAFWDISQPRERAHVDPPAYCVKFVEGGKLLVLCNESGVERWPARLADAAGPMMLGPGKRFGELPWAKHLCAVPGTRKIAVARASVSGLVDLDQPSTPTWLAPPSVAHFISASPDGRWLATGSAHTAGADIWEAATGRRAATLPTTGPVEVLFSPDGRWLATACPGEIRLWHASSWKPYLTFSTEPSFNDAQLAFSPDGRMLAIRQSPTAVQLVDPQTGREWATIPGQRPRPLCFNPDGTLLVLAEDSYRLKIWNLRLLREELGRLKVDWDLPPYPPAPDARPSPPLRIEVVTK